MSEKVDDNQCYGYYSCYKKDWRKRTWELYGDLLLEQ